MEEFEELFADLREGVREAVIHLVHLPHKWTNTALSKDETRCLCYNLVLISAEGGLYEEFPQSNKLVSVPTNAKEKEALKKAFKVAIRKRIAGRLTPELKQICDPQLALFLLQE